MNLTQLAKTIGVSATSVSVWIKKGCPHRRTTTGAYQFLLSDVQRWRAESLRTPSTEPSTYASARARKESALAGLRELQLREKTGELVLRSAVEVRVFSLHRRVRDGFLNLPARLGGIFAAETDQQKIHAMMTKEIHQILEELCHPPTPAPSSNTPSKTAGSPTIARAATAR